MKRWRPIAAVVLGFLASLLVAGTALAQAEDLPPILASVLTKLAVLFDGMLDFWVVGNTLTDPIGERLVGSLGQMAVNVVDFFAWLFEPFTFG